MNIFPRLLPVALLLTVAGGVSAQAPLPLQVDLDHAAFAYNEESSLVEFYLAFEAASLGYQADTSGFVAALPINIQLRRSTQATLPGTPEEPVWQDSVLLRFAVPDTAALAPGQQFIHQLRTDVPPGEYELRLSILGDAGQGRRELELRRDVLVPDFSNEDLVGLSDITLASVIQPSDDRDNLFYKNGLLVQPNANQLFGVGLDQLYYYAEAYHADQTAGADGEYTLYAYVSEANRPQPIGTLERRMDREARSPDVLVGSFDLSALPSGAYFLRLALLNDNNESVAEQSRKFFIYNPNVERQAETAFEQSFEMSPYASMTEEQVTNEFERLRLIASEREQRRFRSIQDLDERRRFLMEFWQQRDPQPSTPINEFREEFFQRVQYANDRYSNAREEGWRTDRGRVIVKYGLPSNIEPHLYDRNLAPHEIWQYNNIPGEGQALFIFADRDGFGRFDLIHSTVSGELSLPNWRQELGQR